LPVLGIFIEHSFFIQFLHMSPGLEKIIWRNRLQRRKCVFW